MNRKVNAGIKKEVTLVTSSASPRQGGQQAFLGLRPPVCRLSGPRWSAGTPAPTVQCPGCTPGLLSAPQAGQAGRLPWGKPPFPHPRHLQEEMQEEGVGWVPSGPFCPGECPASSCSLLAAMEKRTRLKVEGAEEGEREGQLSMRRMRGMGKAPTARRRWRRPGWCAPSAASRG